MPHFIFYYLGIMLAAKIGTILLMLQGVSQLYHLWASN